MTKLELLKKQLGMLDNLIASTDDVEKQKGYIKERDDVNIQIGKEEALAEMKAAEEKKAQEEMTEKAVNKKKAEESVFAKQPTVVVGEPDNYKGFNLKRVVGDIDMIEGVSATVKNRVKARPEQSIGLMKHFADLYLEAKAHPLASKAAMQEGTDPEGGYLTPTEQRAELFAYVRELSVTMPDVTHVPMTSDVMTVPAELSNVSVAWTAEEADATASNPTFKQITLTAKRLDAYSTSSNELIEDTNVPGGIVAVLLSQFTEAVAKELDNQVLTGTGSPVSGIFTAQAGYSEVFSSGSTAFSELLESNVRNLIGKIPPERLDGAKWYMNNSVLWQYFYGLKDGDSRPLFIPSMSQGVPHTLFGYPVKQSSQATSVSAAGATMAAFGNLKGFVVGDRLTNIKLFIDPYTLGKSYQTNFYFFTRWAFAHALPGYYGRIVTAAS